MAKVAVVAALVVAVAWAWTRHARAVNEHQLAAVASELAGREVEVRCQGFWAELLDIQDRAGEVPFPNGRPPDHTYLTRKTCAELKRFRSRSTHPQLSCLVSVDWSRWTVAAGFHSPCADEARPVAQAVVTFAHESMHLRGFADEAQAQCYAIQAVAWTVTRLGGTPAEGSAVAQFALAQQPALPAEYQSADCRAGGALDLYAATEAFPTEATPALPPRGFYGPLLEGR